MKKILNVVGARPNFMKIGPIQRRLEKYPGDFEPLLIHTGQHYDTRMSKLFFEDLQLPAPDVYLGIGSGSHAEQTAKVMIAFEKICEEQKPDLVLVVGDVNSTAACSMVAAKMWIPIAHVEAGLRSFDRRMPEEINRIITDNLADLLFTTEQSGTENLLNEGIDREKIHFVGNVMIDSLIASLEKAGESRMLESQKLSRGGYALVTLHRPSNVDNEESLSSLLSLFAKIEKDLPIVFPIHPRTQKNLELFGLKDATRQLKNVLFLPPIGYLDFMQLMQNARFVMTDSGGIQEETTYLGIPCITIRENTERPSTVEIGSNELAGNDPKKIFDLVQKILSGRWKEGRVPELWDGRTAERIVDILMGSLK